MTRKGLAFGAGMALIGSGIVALPAQAAGTITLGPDAGTSYNTLTSSEFTLMPVMAGVASGDYMYLRYKVTNADENTFRFDIRQGASGEDGETLYQYGTASTAAIAGTTSISSFAITGNADGTDDVFAFTVAKPNLIEADDVLTFADFAYASSDSGIVSSVNALDGDGAVTVSGDVVTVTYNDTTGDVGASDDVSSTAATGGTIAVNNISKDDSFVIMPDDLNSSGGLGNNVAAIGGQNYLDIKAQDLDSTTSVTVQAWIDGNQNNIIDAGEISSAVVTVTFKPVSTLSASASLDALYASATTATVSATITGDINYQQIDSGDVTATLSGGSITGTVADQALAWNAVTGRFEVGFSGLGSIDSGETITATIEVDNDYDGSVDDSKATTSKTVATTVADVTFEAAVVNSATAVSTQSSRSDTGSGDVADFATRAGTGAVLEGSTGFSVSMFVGTDAVTAIGISSVPVQVTVTSTNVTATDAVTVGGKALVSGTSTVVDVTTDANGRATLAVTLGAADDDDTITFAFAPYGTSLGSSNLVVTVTDNSGDYVLTQLTPGSPSIKAGDTLSIEYRVVDLFGVAPANNTHSVLVAPTANERTKAADWSYSIPVVDGKAVLTVKDNGTGNGKFTANAKLVLNGTTTALTNGTVDVVVNVVADPAAATLTLEKLTYGTAQANDANNDGDFADTGDTDNTGALLVESRAFANYDSRYAIPTVSAPTVRDTYKVVVGAKATNAAAAAVVGAPVTFAAAGMLFKSGTVYSKDSITVHAGSTGIASVEVWSSVGGAREVKITSGAATVTQKLTFAAGTGSAGSFTVSAPTSSTAGKTADVVVKVLDSLGNPAKGVSVTLFSTGPGYLINTTGTTLTDGTFSTKLLIGSNDSGTAVVSAVVTIAGVETIKTTSIRVGGTVNVGSFNGKLVVYASGLNGQTISWKVGGRWGKAVATSDYAVFDRPTPVRGVTVPVNLYINGVLTLTKNVTTR